MDWQPDNTDYPPPKAGEPPLHCAARLGDHDAILRLVKEGSDLNATFNIRLDPGAMSQPATPLMVAAGSGDGATVDTVNLLLKLGADPKVVYANMSAASFAVSGLGWNYRPGGDIERLNALLAAGSPLSGSARQSNRMLCDALMLENVLLAERLLSLGLDASGYWNQRESRDEFERLMQHIGLPGPELVSIIGQERVDKQIEQMSEQMSSAPSGLEIPLFAAAEGGDAACVELVLDRGADLNARDNSKRTALYHAGSQEIVDLLVASGLSIEDQDQFDWSPLCRAVSDGSLDRVRWFMAAGGDVNATHDRGYTVFMTAVSSMDRSVEVMEALVAGGANPHAVTELGYNAFHAAVDVNGEANAEESVRSTMTYLHSLGVDINLQNNGGETPLARAKRWGTPLECEILEALGATE